MKILKFVFLFILIANAIIAQKPFTFSAESGIILPIPIFYKGLVASSNEDREIETPLGIIGLVNCKWNYHSKSYLTLGLFYESYSLNTKDYARFPSDITPDGFPLSNRSYDYSNFDAKNLGLRLSFGNTLTQYIKLNAGFQLGFPLNSHFGYIYVGSLNLIEKRYEFKTNKPFAIFTNVEYQWYSTKNFEFTLVPELVLNLQKDAKTYIYENQIRKLYFALRIGIHFKS